jgi:hypothetical protein
MFTDPLTSNRRSIDMCIGSRGNVFTESLPSNESIRYNIDQERWAMIWKKTVLVGTISAFTQRYWTQIWKICGRTAGVWTRLLQSRRLKRYHYTSLLGEKEGDCFTGGTRRPRGGHGNRGLVTDQHIGQTAQNGRLSILCTHCRLLLSRRQSMNQ